MKVQEKHNNLEITFDYNDFRNGMAQRVISLLKQYRATYIASSKKWIVKSDETLSESLKIIDSEYNVPEKDLMQLDLFDAEAWWNGVEQANKGLIVEYK